MESLAEQLRSMSTLEEGSDGESSPDTDGDFTPETSTSPSSDDMQFEAEWAKFEASFDANTRACWSDDEFLNTGIADLLLDEYEHQYGDDEDWDSEADESDEPDEPEEPPPRLSNPPKPYRRYRGAHKRHPYDGGVRMLKLAVFNARQQRDPLPLLIPALRPASTNDKEVRKFADLQKRVSVVENLLRDTQPTNSLFLHRRESQDPDRHGASLIDTVDLRKQAALGWRNEGLLHDAEKVFSYEEYHTQYFAIDCLDENDDEEDRFNTCRDYV